MEIKGASIFKAIAFSKVSRILKDLTVDVRKACEEGTLKDIEGLGESSCRIITEFVKTGRSTDFDEVAASVPAGLLPLLEIPGLGPKTIALFWKERNITSLEELVKAIDEGTLAGLKGIGEKKITSIKEGIAIRSQAAQRMGIGEALPIAEGLVGRLRTIKAVKQAEIAGSLRRRRDTIGDVDLIYVAGAERPRRRRGSGRGLREISRSAEDPRPGKHQGQRFDGGGIAGRSAHRACRQFRRGAALLHRLQGPQCKLHAVTEQQEMSLTLNEWGLYRLSEYDKAAKKSGEAPAVKPVASKTEQDVYKALGLPWIDPELRESRGEIDAAIAGKLPRLITLADIRGDLHTHTTASDGANSIEEMAWAALALGYDFLAITDHSKSQVIANGLSAERLLKHVAEIRKANDRIKGITLLAGCEVDILVDGRMDFEDEILAELDIVIGSPHVSLKQDEQKATDRLLRAIDNKYVNVIGHPTGRLINRRTGLPIDIGKITQAAAASGTALEINAGYPRLDLNDIHARIALEAGAMLAVDTDAHSVAGLSELTLGLDVARRAWATPEKVINCMTVGALKKFLGKKRDR